MSVILLLILAAEFSQALSPVPGVITLGTATTPTKAVAGAMGDSTQIVCNFTPTVASGVSQLAVYCISSGAVALSNTYKLRVTGFGDAIISGVNGVAWVLMQGASQSQDSWNLSANGTNASGVFP